MKLFSIGITPKRVEFFVNNNIKIAHIETNGCFTYFVARNGNIYMCGFIDNGYIETPTLLKGFSFAPLSKKPSNDLLERFEYLTKIIKPKKHLF